MRRVPFFLAILLLATVFSFAQQFTLVKDINTTTNSQGSNHFNMVAKGTDLYFTASSLTMGNELWKSDGTAAGTVVVKDIYAGTTGATPQNLTNVNGTLYFSVQDGING